MTPQQRKAFEYVRDEMHGEPERVWVEGYGENASGYVNSQPEQDEVDIRSRLYQRIHELETQLAQPEQEPLTGGDERRHIICLCPDCTKPAQPEHKQMHPEIRKMWENHFDKLFSAQTDQYAKGYADAMSWKTANHLEHLPVELVKQFSLLLWDYQELERTFEKVTGGKWIRKINTPQRTWVGLTDEEKSLDGAPVNYGIEEACAWVSGAEWAEAKLKEKNNA